MLHLAHDATDGIPNQRLARQLSTNRMTVLLWRRRFEQEGLGGILEDRPRSGRPKQVTADEEADIVERTRTTKPSHATHWTVRTMAQEVGVSPATVHASGRLTDCNRTASRTSSSARTRSLCARCATSWASI